MSSFRSVAAVAVAVLVVWSAAFGGGYTLALFSADTNVSGSFTAADEFTTVGDEDPQQGAAVDTPTNNSTGTAPVGNDSLSSDGNSTETDRSGQNATTPDQSNSTVGNESGSSDSKQAESDDEDRATAGSDAGNSSTDAESTETGATPVGDDRAAEDETESHDEAGEDETESHDGAAEGETESHDESDSNATTTDLSQKES